MSKSLWAIAPDEWEYSDAGWTATATGGAVVLRGSPEGFPLWLYRVRLGPGDEVLWQSWHGEEVVYVVSGSVAVDGQTCATGAAFILEAGAQARLVASAAAQLVHMGSQLIPDAHVMRATGDGVHVIGPRGIWELVADGRTTHLLTDPQAHNYRAHLHYTARETEFTSTPHSHSQDELIHVLEGELRLGARRLGPGSTLAIRADHRYGFKSGPSGFAFINFRPDESVMTRERGSAPLSESPQDNGFTRVPSTAT